MDLVKKARARMMLAHPFFATLLMSLDAIETDTLPDGSPNHTLATDMKKIYYNRKFIEEHMNTVELVMFGFAHEVLHVAFENGLRLQKRNPLIWNLATDFANNLILQESGFKLLEGCLYDAKLKGQSADQIYDKLMKQARKAQAEGGKGQPGEGGIPGFDKMHGPDGDLMQPPNQSPAEEAETRRQIQQKVAQAANVARMAGKLSGELERFVNEVLDPKVPWQVILRDYMTRAVKNDETWSRRNRRFQNIYLPTRHSERMGEIIAIGDTSGSIGNEELCQYMAEVNSIVEDVRPERVRILWADTKVAGEQVFEDGEPIVPKPKGGGGTDMRIPCQHAVQYEPEVVILFTDGYTPWPDCEPPYHLIVCCTTDAPVPVGQVVRI